MNFTEKYYHRSLEALSTALDTVPAYKTWRQFDPGKNSGIDERYAALPILTKKDIRENFPDGLVPDNRNTAEGLKFGEIEYIQTSGTTAEKVTNLWNQKWWNESESASWMLNSYTDHLNHSFREAQLTSALSVGIHSENDLPMESRILNGRFLFLNEKKGADEWKDYHYTRMAVELNKFKPAVIEANPSYLARFAWWAIDNKIKVFAPDVIIFTYELPSAMQLDSIRQVFPVHMASSYGTTEAGYIFMECECGTLHQNTEFCRIDFNPLKKDHGGPSVGRILATIFNNPWVSLIRFDVGDLVRIKEDASCRCGRGQGFMLSDIEGRIINSTFTTSGRLVTTREVDDAMSAVKKIRDYHLEQVTHNNFIVKIVTAPGQDKAVEQARKTLENLYGKKASVKAVLCADILPGPSGKYRRTQADFDFDIKEFLA